MKRMVTLALAAAIGLAGLLPTVARAQVRYTVTDLGTLSKGTGRESRACAINESGAVAGYATYAYDGSTNSWITHAFVWTPTAANATTGKMADLGTLPGGTNSAAYGISADGTAVGHSDSAAVLWSRGVVSALPWPSARTDARAINSADTICGWGPGPTDTDAALWQGGTASDLGAGHAYGINDDTNPLVVGWHGAGTDPANGQALLHACTWQGGVLTDLGGLPGYPDTKAYAVNLQGQVTGQAFCLDSVGAVVTASQPFLWQAGSMVGLGTLGGASGQALAINASGQIVGSATGSDGGTRAFSWTPAAGMVDLNKQIKSGSGWVLTEARGINGKGQIVGYGSYNKNYHAFLLTPQ